jgi:hypothetical protein
MLPVANEDVAARPERCVPRQKLDRTRGVIRVVRHHFARIKREYLVWFVVDQQTAADAV